MYFIDSGSTKKKRGNCSRRQSVGQGGYALLAFFVGAQVVLHAACGASMMKLLLLFFGDRSTRSRRVQLGRCLRVWDEEGGRG